MFWILQHQDVVPAGRYAALLSERLIPRQTCLMHYDDPLPELQPGDRVLVLGGTMGAYEGARYPWLSPLKGWLRSAAENDVPILAICLGAQLLAEALGGVVTANSHSERGMCRIQLDERAASDPLFDNLPHAFPALQWHNDSFTLPPGATLLAASEACPVQVFRYRNAYAVQFHPEVDSETVTLWNRRLKVPGSYDQEFRAAQGDWQPIWDRLFDNFLGLESGYEAS